jgi:hypothetical protein
MNDAAITRRPYAEVGPTGDLYGHLIRSFAGGVQ